MLKKSIFFNRCFETIQNYSQTILSQELFEKKNVFSGKNAKHVIELLTIFKKPRCIAVTGECFDIWNI